MGITSSRHAELVDRSPLYHLRQHLSLRYDLALHGGDALHPTGSAAHLDYFHFQPELISRANRFPELDPVEPHEVHHLGLGPFHGAHHQAAAGLGHGLYDQDAGHDRMAGEMALKERLVDRNVLEADYAGGALDFDDAIDEEKWVAMGERLEDAFDIHGAIRYPLSAIRQRLADTAVEV
jgi:hypothetical protein